MPLLIGREIGAKIVAAGWSVPGEYEFYDAPIHPGHGQLDRRSHILFNPLYD